MKIDWLGLTTPIMLIAMCCGLYILGTSPETPFEWYKLGKVFLVGLMVGTIIYWIDLPMRRKKRHEKKLRDELMGVDDDGI